MKMNAKTEMAIDVLQAILTQQIENEGLWFEVETCPEGLLQQELRRLHYVAEELLNKIAEDDA